MGKRTILESSKDFIRETRKNYWKKKLNILRIKQKARNRIEIVGYYKIIDYSNEGVDFIR